MKECDYVLDLPIGFVIMLVLLVKQYPTLPGMYLSKWETEPIVSRILKTHERYMENGEILPIHCSAVALDLLRLLILREMQTALVSGGRTLVLPPFAWETLLSALTDVERGEA